MEKVYVIRDVFANHFYRKDSNNDKIQPYMGGGILAFWDENLIKFASKEDAETVIKHRNLNNVIILEVYTR